MLTLANLFSDHAVLQQGKNAAVWGWTDKKIFVELVLKDANGNVVAERCCRSNGDTGKFLLYIPAMPAGGPYSMIVSSSNGESLVREDIYFGEVWLAGGQSNMEMPLAGFVAPVLFRDKLQFHAPVRMITVPRKMSGSVREDVEAVWTLPEGDDLEMWSAAGAYFAAALTRELNVPVGIVAVNWGGSFAETWMSRYALIEAGVSEEKLNNIEEYLSDRNYWDLVRAKGIEFFETSPTDDISNFFLSHLLADFNIVNKGEADGWHLPDFDDSAWKCVELPESWQKAGILQGSGLVWFRKKVTVPEGWCGRELLLKVGACDKQDITYVNGVMVGATGKDMEDQYWNVPRCYKVSADIAGGREISIAVRVYSYKFQGGMIGPAEDMKLELADDPSESISLAGEWSAAVEDAVKGGGVAGIGLFNTCSALYEEMLYPLAPFSVRGAIWYQGESNAERHESYRKIMNCLITDWRRLFRMPDMPFYQVLLAGFADWPGWPELREAQVLSAKDTGSGYASAVDVGDAADIHPLDKYHVGERLAAAALHDTYKMDITGYGPEVEEVAWSSDDVKVLCCNAEGLHAENGNPGGWEIAGADGVFKDAEVSIFGNTLLISHPDVQDPVEIRYAWHINPEKANLYNGAGLPMIPCRVKK